MGPVPVRDTTNGAGPPRPAPPSTAPGARVPPPPLTYRRKPLQPRGVPPPPPPRSRSRSARGWCCVCCLWLVLTLLGAAFLCAVAARALYVAYHPQVPTFAVTSLRLAALDVSDSDAVTSRVEFTVTARNPNEAVAFAYGDIAVSWFSADGVIAGCVVPGFLHPAGNTTVVRAAATAVAVTVDPVQAAALSSRKTHDLWAQMDTEVGFRIGRFQSKRIGVRVSCGGISASVAKPEPDAAAAPAPAQPRRAGARSSSSSTGAGKAEMTTTDAKCKLRVKVWIWTF